MTRPAMTADEATTFDRYSVSNAAQLTAAAEARGCHCEPYADWYTFGRWRAQGFHVRRGEHSTRIATFAPITRTDPDTGEVTVIGSRPWTSHVFCRCQVDTG